MTKQEVMAALEAVKLQLETEVVEDKANGIAGRPAFTVIAIFLQGSQNYNLESYTDEYMSDIDCKAFILPSFDDLYNNKFYSKTLQTEYGQVEVKDIRKLNELMKKANPSYIELLFTEYSIFKDKSLMKEPLMKLGQDLVNERKALLLRAAYGTLVQKHKALTHPYEGLKDKIAKYGYDPKQLHHIVRLYYLVLDIVNDVPYKDALKPAGEKHDFLMEIKFGKFDLEVAEFTANMYDELTKKIVDEQPIEGTISNNTLEKISKLILETVRVELTNELTK